jgi:hypothetical protein
MDKLNKVKKEDVKIKASDLAEKPEIAKAVGDMEKDGVEVTITSEGKINVSYDDLSKLIESRIITVTSKEKILEHLNAKR